MAMVSSEKSLKILKKVVDKGRASCYIKRAVRNGAGARGSKEKVLGKLEKSLDRPVEVW